MRNRWYPQKGHQMCVSQEAPVESHRHRPLPYPQPRRDLGLRQPLDVVLHQRLPRFLREHRQGTVEQVGQFVVLQVERQVVVIDQAHASGRSVTGISGKGRGEMRRVTPLLVRPAPADVARDGREPKAYPLLIAQLIGVTPRLDQRLLGQILGALRGPSELGAQADEARPFQRQDGRHIDRNVGLHSSHHLPPSACQISCAIPLHIHIARSARNLTPFLG